ncbi:hypothetical protein V492_01745 [Pseudogymnoascus sp. VKM F-4246]|nr:hypothetical protein V492_01745 [Pseudogymnoascus sp. VKM F-4246]
MELNLEKSPSTSVSKEYPTDPESQVAGKNENAHSIFKLEEDGATSANSSPPSKDFDNNATDPRMWTFGKKLPIAMFAISSVFTASFGIPIYIGAVPGVAAEFHVNATESILPTCLYAWCLGLGVLLGTAASEVFGRTIIYRVSLPLILIFTIVSAIAKNFATLCAGKALAGIFAGPCLAIGVGVLNDIWNLSVERIGTAFVFLLGMGVIFASQASLPAQRILAPAMVGPMASHSIVTYHTWQWTIWISVIMTGILTVVAFFVPETYGPAILREQARKSGQPLPSRGSVASLIITSLFRPMHMLIVEPIVFPSALVLSVSQSIIFTYYVAYSLLFKEVYHFTDYQVGLAFAPLLVGSVIAMPIVAVFDKLTYQKAQQIAIRTGGPPVEPEIRLYPVMLSAILLPISLFWFAWTGRPEFHWAVPLTSGILSGIAYVLNMICLTVYNNEVYAMSYGASVMAGTTFTRFAISSAFPLFTSQMVSKLGFSWAVSLLGFVTVAMMPIPWVFFKWGPALRAGSKYLKKK